MKLQAYILRQMLTALLFGVVSIVVLAVPGVAVNAVHKLPAADASLLAAYLPTVLQTLAPYVLPLCFLLAVVGTYGRLAADREWTAIQMAGFHPLGRLLPGVALAAEQQEEEAVADRLGRAHARPARRLGEAARVHHARRDRVDLAKGRDRGEIGERCYNEGFG